MKLFKPKARLSDICQKFYDDFILHPTLAGIDINLSSDYFESLRESIIEVDPEFSSVEEEEFVAEMMAIWFEIFGLAWLYEAGEKYVAEQSAFTKSYLGRESRPDIWEAMGEYNQAIAQSVTYGVTPDTAIGRMTLVKHDQEKIDKFKLWTGQGIDAKCVARAANRLGTEKSWADNRTRGFLVFTLCKRIGCDPNDEARFRLEAVIFGFYNGAKEFLSEVRVTL